MAKGDRRRARFNALTKGIPVHRLELMFNKLTRGIDWRRSGKPSLREAYAVGLPYLNLKPIKESALKEALLTLH